MNKYEQWLEFKRVLSEPKIKVGTKILLRGGLTVQTVKRIEGGIIETEFGSVCDAITLECVCGCRTVFDIVE